MEVKGRVGKGIGNEGKGSEMAGRDGREGKEGEDRNEKKS